MLAAQAVSLGLLLLLLRGGLGLLLLLCLSKLMRCGFLGGDDFVLDILVIVGPTTRRTEAVHVGLDVVVAELAYLVATRT